MIQNILLVGLGSFLGGILRYIVSYILLKPIANFPLGTFVVNILGCFIIGILTSLGVKYSGFNQMHSFIFITGFCGSFTTFSTFSNEGLLMLQNHSYLLFGIYVIASIVLGLLFVWLGYKLV